MNGMHRPFLCLLVVALVAGLGGATPLAQQPAPDGATPGEPAVVRLYVSGRDDLNRIAGALDIWRVSYDKGFALVAVTPEQYARLESQGYRLEIDAENTEKLRHPAGIPSYPCYRTVEETYAAIQKLANEHPDLADVLDIGDSWDKVVPGGPAGYDMLRLRITNHNIPGPKPTFFLMAEIHAREYVTAETATRLAEYLVDLYGTDPAITFFIDYSNIDIVPMTNPDGRKFAEQGILWRKNTDNVAGGGCGYPNYGIDLNRNHSFKWGCCGGSSGDPCSGGYRGPMPGSEPETTAIQSYVMSIFPDQRGPGDTEPAPLDATGLLITLHSFGELVLWPWGWIGMDAPNAAQLQTLGVKLATYNGHTPQQSFDLYVTDGTSDDWSYGVLGIASYTFEMGTDFFQGCGTYEGTIWPGNRDALLYALKVPDTPYMTPYGPDTLDALAVPTIVSPGDPVQLTAMIDDESNGNQVVQAAEYYLLPLHDPTPPGEPGAGTAMQPADGSWSSAVEAVRADIDTSSLELGTYLLAVRGRDAGDHWGPFAAAFLYVAEPGVSPTIEGAVREMGSELPLQATVTAGNFRAATDPATGLYSMRVISGTYDVTATAADHAPVTATGVRAENYQTVEQDFSLSPLCELFADDMENGTNGWLPGGSPNLWAQVDYQSHSPTHSWTDSPIGLYGNNVNNWVSSPILDLAADTGITLSFWHHCMTEAGYDYASVEYSIDGGTTWSTAATFDGEHPAWMQEQLPLPALDGQANARIRFRLTSDGNQQLDGWYVDDVSITGGGPACQPALAPEAEFSTNSPVTLGEPMVFTNQTAGLEPLSFGWEFGDGAGASNERDPSYTYLSTGTFTVTLTATNTLGSSVAEHAVRVDPAPCADVTGVTIDGPPGGPPGTYAFTATVQPPDATEPVAWLWDNGDTTATSVRELLDEATYTLVVTATNCLDARATASHTIAIEAPHLFVYLPVVAKNH